MWFLKKIILYAPAPAKALQKLSRKTTCNYIAARSVDSRDPTRDD